MADVVIDPTQADPMVLESNVPPLPQVSQEQLLKRSEVLAQDAANRPKPLEELTPEQRRIRQLEDDLAKALGIKERPETLVESKTGETILIHILVDGFTAWGNVWYRGQEIELDVGDKMWERTLDRRGKSWLDLRDDPAAQYALWGEEKFRSGPWPGASYKAGLGQYQPIQGSPPPTLAELEQAEQMERARRRAIPMQV